MAEVVANSSVQGNPAVRGTHTSGGLGVLGESGQSPGVAVLGNGGDNGRGVVGVSQSASAVEGNTTSGVAVIGIASGSGRGIVGVSQSGSAVEGDSKQGTAIFAKSDSGLAGDFVGNVHISGQLLLLGNDVLENLQLIGNLSQQIRDVGAQFSTISSQTNNLQQAVNSLTQAVSQQNQQVDVVLAALTARVSALEVRRA